MCRVGLVSCLTAISLVAALGCGTSGSGKRERVSDETATKKRASSGASASETSVPSPKPGYRAYEMAGFSVLVNEAVFEHPAESRELLARLPVQLEEAVALLGAKVTDPLRAVRVWVEWVSHDTKRVRGPAEFHRSRTWLAENGYDPDKERSVEISTTAGFLAASASNQPNLLLHELVHAYDEIVLGRTDQEVARAFASAESSGRYASVARVGDQSPSRAYALTDASEYLSELAEAYLGMNDYFPHVREQLAGFDPAGHALAERFFGPPRARPLLTLASCGTHGRTTEDGRATAVVIANRASADLEIGWLDRAGSVVPMTTLRANQTYVQQTFRGHVFVVAKSGGSCVGQFIGADAVSALSVGP